MASLPTRSGHEVVRILRTFDWSVARQRGSHIVMTRGGEMATLSIPDHKEVAKGAPRSLIRSANLTVNESVEAA